MTVEYESNLFSEDLPGLVNCLFPEVSMEFLGILESGKQLCK